MLDDLSHVDVFVFKEECVLLVQRFNQSIDGHLPIFSSLHSIELLLANVHDSAEYALCDVSENYVVELNFEDILGIVIC